ncbi:MAG TPA: hypothetical protein VFE34_22040 [Dongiaceae bacterium]|nr:hypothetical protein [Dongiaceae bacterium]
MPTTGHWGWIIAVTRLATGLILFFYVLTHNLNHGLGLISLSAMESGRSVFLGFWRPLELLLLLAALLDGAARSRCAAVNRSWSPSRSTMRP